MPVEYPPFQLQADSEALRAIANGIAGIKVEDSGCVWLRDTDSRCWLISIHSRDLCFKFEVFALAITGIGELQANWRNWKPPLVPPELPEPLRSLMSARPREPTPPLAFDDWPFAIRHVDVLRRVEWIASLDTGPTAGDNPNVQSATRSGRIPPAATATCEVAVGLLFNGQQDERLLIAAGWMPMELIVTREADRIDAFLADCDPIDSLPIKARPALDDCP